MQPMSDTTYLTPEVLVPRIGDALVERGLLSPEDLTRALEIQNKLRESGQKPPLLGQILIQENLIDRASLDYVVTDQVIKLKTALQDANAQLELRVQQRTAELENALRQLSELSELKANFVANISHELRTPLTHLKGYLELFIAGDMGELQNEQMRVMTTMLRSTERLERLIEDLINFSSTESGQITLRRKKVDVSPICREVIRRSIEKASRQGVRLDLECLTRMPPIVVDEEKILWVLMHLIDNSVKFTPTGGKVTLRAFREDNFLHFEVEDTGIGIAEDQLAKIFDPFYQVDGSSTRKYGGTGLGLALAAKIIKAHGSVIQVQSELAQGSKFYFILPIEQKNEPTEMVS